METVQILKSMNDSSYQEILLKLNASASSDVSGKWIVTIERTLDGTLSYIEVENIEITLKGLEYLAEKPMMKKC